jgi:hypothetical protein
VVEINLSQPHAEELVELRAWEIIEEMIKIHRVGYRFTSLTTDQKLTCSGRIAKALQIIKDYAIVRKKLLENDRIPDFCVGPKQYASTTVVSFWSNCNKAAIAARSTTAPRNPAPQRIPVATGSVALRYQPRSALPTKKSKAAKKSAGEVGPTSKTTALSRSRRVLSREVGTMMQLRLQESTREKALLTAAGSTRILSGKKI